MSLENVTANKWSGFGLCPGVLLLLLWSRFMFLWAFDERGNSTSAAATTAATTDCKKEARGRRAFQRAILVGYSFSDCGHRSSGYRTGCATKRNIPQVPMVTNQIKRSHTARQGGELILTIRSLTVLPLTHKYRPINLSKIVF